MEIANNFKGHAVSTIIQCLLTDAGYHVTPMGIENLVPELRMLDRDDYLDIANNWKGLRLMPDLFVLDREEANAWVVEVKYRDSIQSDLVSCIRAQHHYWSNLTVVLALKRPPESWSGTIRHIRAFEVRRKISPDFFEAEAKRIQDIFPKLSDRWEDGTLIQAQEFILRMVSSNTTEEPVG